jgi:hypothetical protein
MKHKTMVVLSATAVLSSIALGTGEQTASARTVNAMAGTSTVGAQRANFNVLVTGVQRSTSGTANWVVPLIFDTPGAKTVTIRGKVSTGGSMVCQVAAVDTTGAIVGFSPLTAFPVTGTYTSMSLTISSVPIGAVGYLYCQMNGGAGGSLAILLGADYPA